ncbi:MAG: choice-of-anchor L domain-containing protein [Bacteroidota bacterium]
MRKNLHSFILILCLLILGRNAFSQLSVTEGVTMNMTPLQLVQNHLVGQGITVTNVTLNGSSGLITSNQIGYFTATTNAAQQLGINAGVLITNGEAKLAIGPNNKGNAGAQTGTGSDPDLHLLMGSSSITLDKCVLEFDFIPQCDTISFRYVFGSEEFYEFCGAGEDINDAFGFFLNGPGISGIFSNNATNLALMPGTSNYVLISNICNAPSSNWDNSGGLYFQYDGITHVFSAWHIVQPGLTYHIKIAIADGFDQTHDSGVFLEKNSFSSGISLNVSNYPTNPAAGPDAIEGCNDYLISFKLGNIAASNNIIHFTIGGTAINGTDYSLIPDFVTIPAGKDSAFIQIHPIIDGFTEGRESVAIGISQASCTGTVSIHDTVWIIDNTPILLSAGDDVTICFGDSATLHASVTGGLPPYEYSWNGATNGDSIIKVSPPAGTYPYIIKVLDKCKTPFYDTVRVVVNPHPVLMNSILEKSICSGDSTQIYLESNITNALFTWEPTLISGSMSGFSSGDGAVINQLLYLINSQPASVVYHILVTAPGCDSSRADFIVHIEHAPERVSTDTLYLATGGMVTLHAPPPFFSCLWSTGSSDSLISVATGGKYWVKVSDSTGCSTSDTTLVKEVGLLVPTAFTPNGDGKNDLFLVEGIDKSLPFSFDIFDRWGTQVFHTNDPLIGWDGTFKNQLLQTGSYIWILKLTPFPDQNQSRKPIVFTGTITLLR